jgi:type IV pilus assembly protein PilQ
VVKRAENLKPDISRRGSLLIVDFPRTGALAARPPVMDAPPAETVLGEPSGTAVAAVPGAETVALGAQAPAAIPMGGDEPTAAAGGMGGQMMPASLEPPASIDILQEGGLIDGKEYSGRRISLDFKEVDIADVLRLIAEVSDLNVIAGDEVKGKVTIRLVDVPWDQALDIILLTKGLGFMRIGNVLRIAPTDVISQEEEARLQERRAKERLEDLVVKLQPVNYADAQDISVMVRELLTERGTVNVDKRTNTLVLKDIPSVIDEATALIKAIDTQTPQVMIEAKIVEAKLKFSREFGSVWSIGAQPLSDAWDDASPLRQDLGSSFARLRPSLLDGAAGATNGVGFANPITTLPTALANIGAYLLDEKINLDLQLQAAEVNGDGKVISSPRVVTMDNSKAKIEQGVSIPFQTFENGDAQLEFVDAVLKLDVTPHITANKAIIMKVKVTRNAPDDSVFTLTGSPAIAKNEVDTETLVKDGQTLVLGGIYTMNKSQRQSRVPYLHRIPILGSAFRNNEVSDDRQELLIFVTPRVVQSDQSAS